MPSIDSEKRARPCSTSSSVAASIVRCRSAAAPAERVGQRQQDAPDFLGLLLLERDDVVVDFDGAERLEKQAGAAGRRAVHDARNAAAVLGLHEQHVAAVALGDDLILQVLRRLLAAQVRLERAAQPRLLLAQPIADQPQLRARVVDDLARRVDLLAHLRRLALERRGAGGGGVEQRKRSRRAADAGARLVDRVEKRRRAPAAAAIRARALRRASAARICGSSLDARSGKRPWAATNRTVSVVAACHCATCCGSMDGASRDRRSAPIGVSAKSVTASTIRSNSRARRALGCMRRGTSDSTVQTGAGGLGSWGVDG